MAFQIRMRIRNMRVVEIGRRIARHADADIARHGMTPGEFSVLEVLYHKGPLLLGEVLTPALLAGVAAVLAGLWAANR